MAPRYAKNANLRRKADHSSLLAAAAAGVEVADGPSRKCGTAAVVSTVAVVWQGGEGTHTGSASSRPQTADFLLFQTYSQETPTAAAAAAQQLHLKKIYDSKNECEKHQL